MVVTDAVLVDILHGEGARLSVVLAIARALDGAMPRSLDNGEDDGLCLEEGILGQRKVESLQMLVSVSR